MIFTAMPTHCDVMRPNSHGAFSPKGRCVGTGRRQQTSAFCFSGRVFSGGACVVNVFTPDNWSKAALREKYLHCKAGNRDTDLQEAYRCRVQRSRGNVRPPPLSILCRTPGDTKTAADRAREKRSAPY